MSLTRQSALPVMQSWVQDTAQKINHTAPGDFGSCIDRAIERYSKDRPRLSYGAFSGDGTTYTFTLSSLTLVAGSAWSEDTSQVLQVRYPDPAPATQRSPNIIFDVTAPHQPELVRFYKSASGSWQMWFQEDTPVTGTSNIAVIYSTLHVVDAVTAANTTVYAGDEQAFQILAASYAAEMLSARYAETKDAAFSVDSVDFRSKSAEYDKLSRTLFRRYAEHLGIPLNGEQPAAGGSVNWVGTMLSGRDRLIRNARNRGGTNSSP